MTGTTCLLPVRVGIGVPLTCVGIVAVALEALVSGTRVCSVCTGDSTGVVAAGSAMPCPSRRTHQNPKAKPHPRIRKRMTIRPTLLPFDDCGGIS